MKSLVGYYCENVQRRGRLTKKRRLKTLRDKKKFKIDSDENISYLE